MSDQHKDEAGGQTLSTARLPETELPAARLPAAWAGAIARARWVLIWEPIWPALVGFLCVIGLFASVSWAGLWTIVPYWPRLLLVGMFIIAAAIALWPLRRLKLPSRDDILRRLDRHSDQRHRPVLSIADKPAGITNAQIDRLWQVHQWRVLERLGPLKTGYPAPDLPRRDPYAVRALILLLTVSGYFYAGEDRWITLKTAFAGERADVAASGRADAWISPPAYTGKAPITLAIDGKDIVKAPENSQFILRSNIDNLTATFEAAEGSSSPIQNSTTDDGSAFGHDLSESGRITVWRDGDPQYGWTFDIVDDTPPKIAWDGTPAPNINGALELRYSLADDYGIVQAKVDTRVIDTENLGDANAAEPLISAPDIDLLLPQAPTRDGKGRSARDMRAHPWAGIEVEMILTALDGANQTGTSAAQRLILPSRSFSQPIARALVEQRRVLALDKRARDRVLRALDAIAIAPEKNIDDTRIYLGLRSAYWRLRNARNDDDLRGVVAYLWEVALAIEDGAMSLAAQNLRDAQERLQQALQEGADSAEIEKLMNELRQAMAEFMNEMARQNGDMENMPQLSQEQLENALSSRDLERMMDQIEQLARSGARDAARELLSQLQTMMDNLRAGQMPQNQMQSQQDMAETLEELGDLMRQQQALMDRTFNYERNSSGDQEQAPSRQDPRNSQRGDQQGQNGGDGDQADSMAALRQQQQALQEALDELMARMEERGQNPSEGLGEAGEAMDEAQSALGDGQPGDAVGDQSRALDNMRQGARQMVDQMRSQMAQQNQVGVGQGGTDPLGRARRQQGQDLGLGVKTPDVFDVEQARRILQELRRRLSDPTRPSQERHYLERLIEGF